jgi:hypothetical protein
MASRRKLKKTIQFVCTELITDVYFRLLINKNIEEKTVEALVVKIVNTSREFTLRSNRPGGKQNPASVKSYYQNLYKAWNEKIAEIIKETESI